MTSTALTSRGSGPVKIARDLRTIPRSDWARFWLTMRARHLPTALARELQLSIAEVSVTAMPLVAAVAMCATVIITVAIVPISRPIGQLWVVVHVVEYIAIFASLAYLRRRRRTGTLTTNAVNQTMLPVVFVGALMWGTLPLVVGTESVDRFYLATALSAIVAVVGFFWTLGHWPLSMLYSSTIVVGVIATYWSMGRSETHMLAALSVMLLAILAILSMLASFGLVNAHYQTVLAYERQQLIGLLLQDYERGDHDWIWEADADLNFSHIPPRMAIAVRGDPRFVVGANLPDSLRNAPAAIRAIDEGESFQATIPVNGPDGVGKIRIWGRPKLFRGRYMGYRGVGSDEQAASDAREAERAAERLDAMATMTSGLAHDFNNLLATVLGAVELAAANPQIPTESQEHLGRAVDACLRTRRLTADLVMASGYEGINQARPFRLIEAVAETVADIVPLYPKVSVTTNLDDVWIVADRSNFLRALRNITENAFQSTNEHDAGEHDAGKHDAGDVPKLVTISAVQTTLEETPVACLHISDNGPGVRAEHVAKLFDPYFSTRQTRGGTGLGLAVARGFALQAGGSLRHVPSDTGATFELIVPISTVDRPSAEGEGGYPGRRRGVHPALNGRFLVVEDDTEVAHNVATMLESFGATVETAYNLDQATQRSIEETASLECVISDLLLPDGEGYEVVATLRTQYPTLKAVYMSGFTRRLPSSVAAELQSPFLTKPFSMDELINAMVLAGVDVFATSGTSVGR